MSNNYYGYNGYYTSQQQQGQTQQQPVHGAVHNDQSYQPYSTAGTTNAQTPTTTQAPSYDGVNRYQNASPSSRAWMNSNPPAAASYMPGRYMGQQNTAQTASSGFPRSGQQPTYGSYNANYSHEQPQQNYAAQPSYGEYHQQQQQRPLPGIRHATQSPIQMQAPQAQQSYGSQQQHNHQQSQAQSHSPHAPYQAHNRQTSNPRPTLNLPPTQPQPHHSSASPAATTTPTSAPAPVTVDPNQIYDRSAEIQREAAKAEAARRAEEEREAAKAEAAKREEEQRREEERRKEEEEKRAKEEEEKKAKQQASEHMAEARKLSKAGAASAQNIKKKRGRKSNTENSADGDTDADANAAAMALLQTANADPMESEMKDMFAKMREFNSKNPALLSRLWQQERDSYLASQGSDSQQAEQQSAKQPTQTLSGDAPPKKKRTPKKDKAQTQTPTKPPAQAQTQATDNQAPKPTNSEIKPSQPRANAAPEATAATSSSVPKPPAPKSKATVWPENRKKQLAEAASNLLEKMPEHQGRTIPATDIARILDGNPSYLELCTEIESRGFKLNKSTFAKALLQAVPDVNKGKPSAAPPPPLQSAPFTPVNSSATATSNTAPTDQQQRNTLGDAENRLMSGETLVGSKGSRARKQQQAESQSQPNGVAPSHVDPRLEGLDAVKQYNETAPNEVQETPDKVTSPNASEKKKRKRLSISKASATPAPPTPVTKEDKARKRTFGDLVDLTQLSDDGAGPPTKRAGSEANGIGANPEKPTSQHYVPSLHTTQPGLQHTYRPLGYAPQVPGMGTPQPHRPQQQRPLPPQAQPPQGFRPPFSQPGHLLNYPQPSYPPPKPNVQPPKPAHGIPRNHPLIDIPTGEKISRSKALRRSTYNHKTIARDVLLACGRHPDMRHLNAHLDILHNLKVNNDTDLSTIRWDLIDPGGAEPGAGAPTGPFPEDEIGDDHLADDESSDNDSVLHPRTTQSFPIGGGSAALIATDVPQSGIKPIRIKHYKPGSSDPVSRHAPSTPLKSHTTGSSTDPKSTNYATLRAAQAAKDGSAPKRGRPVGWRKWMQKDSANSSPSTPKAPGSGTGTGKPRGRPPGGKRPPKEPSPEFHPFVCKWRDCNAELHNLETLRRHIHKHHCHSSDDGYACHWQNCSTGPDDEETRLFSTPDEWKHHVETAHLTPMQWAQGDGPATGLVDPDGELSDAILSDREGRQVTPRIEMPSSPAAAAERAALDRARGLQGPSGAGSGRDERTYAEEERVRRTGVVFGEGLKIHDGVKQGLKEGSVELVDKEGFDEAG